MTLLELLTDDKIIPHSYNIVLALIFIKICVGTIINKCKEVRFYLSRYSKIIFFCIYFNCKMRSFNLCQ